MLADRELQVFLREYAPKAMKEATALVRRWRVPTTVTVEDVAQELMLGVVQANREYDPSKGMTWKNFVLWNATYHAKRWIHRQRGALRLSGKARTREHRSLDAMQEDGVHLGGFSVPAEQEATFDFNAGVARLRAMRGGDEFLASLQAGDCRRGSKLVQVLTGDA